MVDVEKCSYTVDARYSPNTECRWKSYSNYRLILLVWMLNEFAIVVAATEISHNGYYIHALLHCVSVIFIGIPLVYSEVCLAQYTNCDVFSMWNFYPLFRPFGYGAIYLTIIKMVYILTLATWYLQYTFYSALDPPPWYTCADFDHATCMVKKKNVSVFQHCLESQIFFDNDCGFKTASYCFFEREIGANTTMKSFYCALSWKNIMASASVCIAVFILSIKKVRFLQLSSKILAIYITIVILLLLSVALSTRGAWCNAQIKVNWVEYHFDNCYKTVIRGFLSLGTGYGIIGYITRDVPFRSPATMTAICVPLFSLFITMMYALIAFTGIKTMSYFHGEEENVIELGITSYFLEFASISEILSYFDEIPLWGFTWFSSIYLCMFIVFWILYLYLKDLIFEHFTYTRRHATLTDVVMTIIICIMSWPLFCADITEIFEDAIEILQIISSFIFSFSLYWVYGYKNHSVDIIFMIGIKPSYFWKIAWLFNPALLLALAYGKLVTLDNQEIEHPLYIEVIGTYYDLLVMYILIGIYGLIILIGILLELYIYYTHGSIRDIFKSLEDWGPTDTILLKSRKMFVPEIMTREFLYRQVRIYGYAKKRNTATLKKTNTKKEVTTSFSVKREWSAMTSN